MIETALEDLRTGSTAARLSAQSALTDAGAPAVDGLLSLLRDTTAPDEARWRAALALGALAALLPDDPRPADGLIETFRSDPVMEVRDCITWTLGEAGLPRLFEPLREAYNDHEDKDLIAYNAALAMARIDRPRALALFQAGTQSPHERVYRVALSTLAALNS
jgi:HEAT repeat protein